MQTYTQENLSLLNFHILIYTKPGPRLYAIMFDEILCCDHIRLSEPIHSEQETAELTPKFDAFLNWACNDTSPTVENPTKCSNFMEKWPFIILLVRQHKLASLESVRYFTTTQGQGEEGDWLELANLEEDLITELSRKPHLYAAP